MCSWITRVSAAGAADVGEEPEPFELYCPCGQAVKGERRPVYQRALCKNCGDAFFILPIDTYAAVAASNRKKKSKRFRRKSRSGSDAAKFAPFGSVRVALQGRLSKARGVAASAASRIATGTRKTFTPFRLVVLSVLGVVVATGYWVVSVRIVEQAEATYESASENGYAALKNGDFAIAAREFKSACSALDIVGRDDYAARVVRQMHREARSASRLSSESLFDMLNEAEEVLGANKQEHWDKHFRANYLDKWIVMQTALTRSVDQAGQVVFSIEFPFMVAGKPVSFEANLAVFKSVSFTEPRSANEPQATKTRVAARNAPSAPRQVIFAAQIDDCHLSTGDSPVWVVRLRSETAFFWSNYENYNHLGFLPDDLDTAERVKQLLEEQSFIMGIKS